jgi:ubiquinone/menaquinone biosynthesis C-methylase UbiE
MRKAALIGAQYDAFAEIYDRYFSDKLEESLKANTPLSATLQQALEQIESYGAVLDCACGPGHLVLGLCKRGYKAQGADISQGMIRIARQHARKEKIRASFHVAEFADLPARFDNSFDLVLCVGNAIGHCRNEREMLTALRGIFRVLKPGGMLQLDTRCWETYHKQKIRFDTFASKTVGDERLTWLNVRHYPKRFSDLHLIEVVIMAERAGDITLRHFPITYYPFREGDLRHKLRAAGFEDIQSTYQKDVDWYQVAARRAK